MFYTGKPPQESRRPRAPAFTFGHKLDPPGSGLTKAGPGPATYNTEGMTAKGELNYVFIVMCVWLFVLLSRRNGAMLWCVFYVWR